MKLQKLTLIIAVLACYTVAETHITGDISGMTLDAMGSPYIVEQDIVIPQGKRAVIKEGTTFLFKPFTGLLVQGHLLAEGTSAKPVVFTSISDNEFNDKSEQLANPFDWNGILVPRESGTVSLKEFRLFYSVYGIKSQNPNIQIQNGVFKQNGQFHFTINDKIQYVQDNHPYSHGITITDGSSSRSPRPAAVKGDKASSPKKQLLRYTSLGVGVAGLTVGTVFLAQTLDTRTKWFEAPYDPEYPTLHYDLEKKFNSQLVRTLISGGIGLLGAIGFGVSFAF